MPAQSPWPAPTPADVAARVAAEQAASVEHDAPSGRTIAGLLSTAKRLSSRAERAAHAAAKQEQRISDELADLPAGWFIQNSFAPLDVGGDDHHIDHLVVGPGGVFSIHLEHQPGARVWVSEHKVTINGRDTEDLRTARFEARYAGGLLTDACGFNVTVQSVLVLIDAATVQTLSCPAEVHVRTQHDIRDWLCKQPSRLDAGTVRAVIECVRRVHTWPGDSFVGLLE